MNNHSIRDLIRMKKLFYKNEQSLYKKYKSYFIRMKKLFYKNEKVIL
jgi:hypothetical protein